MIEQALVPTSGVLLAPQEGHAWYRIDHDVMALSFREGTPYEVWEVETVRLLDVARGIQWLVGDALAFGEHAYGERASQILDHERYTLDTVSRMARTSRAIPPHRRRPLLSHSLHAEVAVLPEREQERLLDYATERLETSRPTTVQEMRVLARRTQRALARAAAEARGTPALPPAGPLVAVADARQLPLPDGFCDLVVTSPPYAVEIPYAVGDVAAEDWPSFLAEALAECWRITKTSGRLALNVPVDAFRGGHRPCYAQATAAALSVGWEYQSTVIWCDNQTTKGNRALGSIDSADRPHHVSQAEAIILLSKGEWGPSSDNPDDITSEQWQQAGRGPWQFPGESHAWEHFPAAFPLELPRRLIRYLSRVGDVVVDPFVGSGTTLLAALETGRRGYGYDLDPAAVASATRRLHAHLGDAHEPTRAGVG
jgi:site-specific DNA-methyltransferase (adenine-specific)